MVGRRFLIAAIKRRARLVEFDIGWVGHQPVDELAQLGLGQRTLELIDRLAADKGKHRRNRADLEVLCELLLLVAVDLDQLEASAIVVFELFEHRPEGLAGAAPGRPEVDQNRHLHRCVDDIGLE